jgi:alkyl hydroperoxide reductase subunit F
MLDAQILEQLKSHFAQIEKQVELVYEPSSHADQAELVDMLESLATTSSKISTKLLAPADGRQSPMPQFHIMYNSKLTGITFKGIPGGHEFSTLVLAILNADGKGKMPDALLKNRIKRLKGPIDIKTFISLTCENCPDVVQALNQMALIHGNFRHEIIDGGYVPEEIKSLGIQGVPSIVVNNKLINSGRITLLDLIVKLEQTFGVSEGESAIVDANLGEFDVVVVGGGPAGVSAAIYSVRKGLKTALLADKMGGQVQETKGIENLISVTYTEGPQLAAQLMAHLNSYPVQVFENRKVKAIVEDKTISKSSAAVPTKNSAKKIELESGEYLTAQATIIATGAKWRELNIPGEKEYLGRGVAFCPHCDGPFYKGKKVAVIGGGNSGVEAAIDLAGIVREVVLIEYASELKADKILVDKLKSRNNISIITNAQTLQMLGDGKKVHALEYLDRSLVDKQAQSQASHSGGTDLTKKQVELDGVFIQIGLIPNSQFLKGVCELTKFGEVIVDAKGHTSTPGIYAAGDVTTTPFKQIIIAMGEGAKTALAAFEDRA